MVETLVAALALSLALNSLFFAIAFILQTDKFTDITYALSFILIALYVYMQSDRTLYETICLGLIIIWGLRLGVFLLYRVTKVGKDNRFDDMRKHFLRFIKFWIGQAVVAWVLLIPVIFVFANTNNTLGIVSCIGIAVWAIGLSIETIADYQKFLFKLNPRNKNKWIENGIWRYSRHPNYFGEMAVWFGVYLYVVPNISIVFASIALVSPLLITVILRYGSGVPILEKYADKKWGSSPQYTAYKQHTNLLIPFPKK